MVKEMTQSIQRKIERSPAEIERLRELRERYQREKPSIADLKANGAEFASMGEVILLRCLAHELKQERERQGITLERVAERIHLTPEVVVEIESGIVAQLNFGRLLQLADILGKRIMISLAEKVA